jgi:small subunit ribosomal protein S16
MLVIRLKRVGRSGHAQFRIVVQDVRQSPKSGQVVAILGTFDPHSKAITINAEKTGVYLKNGAQPSDRVAILLKQQGIKLPKWVLAATKKQRTTRNTEKLRKNRTEEVKAPIADVEVVADVPADSDAVTDVHVSDDNPVEAEATEVEAAEEDVQAPEAEVEATESTEEADTPESVTEDTTATKE